MFQPKFVIRIWIDLGFGAQHYFVDIRQATHGRNDNTLNVGVFDLLERLNVLLKYCGHSCVCVVTAVDNSQETATDRKHAFRRDLTVQLCANLPCSSNMMVASNDAVSFYPLGLRVARMTCSRTTGTQ